MDLAEVELVDTYLDEPRGNDSQLLAVSLKNKSLIHMKTRQKLVKMYESLCDTLISRESLRVNFSLILPFPLTSVHGLSNTAKFFS